MLNRLEILNSTEKVHELAAVLCSLNRHHSQAVVDFVERRGLLQQQKEKLDDDDAADDDDAVNSSPVSTPSTSPDGECVVGFIFFLITFILMQHYTSIPRLRCNNVTENEFI